MSEYKVRENGKITKCYAVWSGIKRRCLNKSVHKEFPTYSDCIICDEWLNFQVFAKWFHENYPDDGKLYQIDKDLKIYKNKLYSPETCVFLEPSVNSFIMNNRESRGDCLIGVSWRKKERKYRAAISDHSSKRAVTIGYFDNELDAHIAWRKRKSSMAMKIAEREERQEVRDAILKWKSMFDNGVIHPYK